VSFVLFAALLSCAGELATSEAAVPGLELVSLDDLRFEPVSLKRQHGVLRDWIVRRSDGFTHLPAAKVGNFVRERWCGSGDPSACTGGAIVGHTEAGTRWRVLETLFYPNGWP
jgi:hypothetical protein